MLAYDGALPIGYAFFPTLISSAAAILGLWTALRLLGQASATRCMVAGTIAAPSVAD
jgi:NO-binding membrane sensor protein with MHYT domain